MASDTPLTDTAAVKSKRGLDLSTSDWDSAIDAWIKEGSRVLTDILGRNLHRVAGHKEKLGSRGGYRLYLREYLPVHEVTEVTYDGDTVDADDYHLEAAKDGELVHDGGGWRDTSYEAGKYGDRQDPRPPEKLYEITYEGGYVTPDQAPFGADNDPRDLPYDIEGAIIEYCVMQYRQAARDKSVKSKKLGKGSITWVEIDGRRVPQSFADVAERYRKPTLA